MPAFRMFANLRGSETAILSEWMMETQSSLVASNSSRGRIRDHHGWHAVASGSLRLIVVIAVLVLHSPATFSADPVNQCKPTGFTLGVPPFRGSYDITRRYESLPLDFTQLQNTLAEILSKSGLFSSVAVFADGPRPDSSDLSLLVSIPVFREAVSGEYPTYELMVDVILVENLDGRSILQRSYSRQFKPRHAQGLPRGVQGRVDAQIAVAEIGIGLAKDLDAELNSYADPALVRLRQSKTSTHTTLEQLRIAPLVVAGSADGLSNYGRFVDEKFREKLARKNCFSLIELRDDEWRCLADSLANGDELVDEAIKACAEGFGWQGFLLVSFLSANDENLRIRSVLVDLPARQVLYDKSLVAPPGWRLGNMLEQHAASIAQASHTIPH